MSGFKQHLELAQSFQVEMADVIGISVMVSVYAYSAGKLVSMSVIGWNLGESDNFFQLIGDKITVESIAEIKEELKGLGYEV